MDCYWFPRQTLSYHDGTREQDRAQYNSSGTTIKHGDWAGLTLCCDRLPADCSCRGGGLTWNDVVYELSGSQLAPIDFYDTDEIERAAFAGTGSCADCNFYNTPECMPMRDKVLAVVMDMEYAPYQAKRDVSEWGCSYYINPDGLQRQSLSQPSGKGS